MRPPENLDDVLGQLAAIAPEASPDEVHRLGETVAALLEVSDAADLKRIGLPDDIRLLIRAMLAVHPGNRPTPVETLRRARREIDRRATRAAARANALAHIARTPRDLAAVMPAVPIDIRVEWTLIVVACLGWLPIIVFKSWGGALITMTLFTTTIGIAALLHRRARRRRVALYERGATALGRIDAVEVAETNFRIRYSFDGRPHLGQFTAARVNAEEHAEGAQILVLVDPRNPVNHAALSEFFQDQRTLPR